MKQVWYVRHKFLILAALIALGALRIYGSYSTRAMIGDRVYVSPEEIARLGREAELRQKVVREVRTPDPTPSATTLPALIYFELDNGATLRLRPTAGTSWATSVAKFTEACVGQTEAAGEGCVRRLQIEPAAWASVSGCHGGQPLGEPGRDFVRDVSLSTIAVGGDAETKLEIKSRPAESPTLGQVYDVIWRAAACAPNRAPAGAPGRIRRVIYLSRSAS